LKYCNKNNSRYATAGPYVSIPVGDFENVLFGLLASRPLYN
jgi:hypothetical protein